jgi:hypothetical protein
MEANNNQCLALRYFGRWVLLCASTGQARHIYVRCAVLGRLGIVEKKGRQSHQDLHTAFLLWKHLAHRNGVFIEMAAKEDVHRHRIQSNELRAFSALMQRLNRIPILSN